MVPPSTWRAMGSMDLRSSLLNWPTISSKKCTRGSLRVKQSCKADWNSHNSSMKPSTSLGTRSKVGMVKPSPLVRQAGNIRGLLRIHEICRRNIRSSCSHVKDRCRCRGKGGLLVLGALCGKAEHVGGDRLKEFDGGVDLPDNFEQSTNRSASHVKIVSRDHE